MKYVFLISIVVAASLHGCGKAGSTAGTQQKDTLVVEHIFPYQSQHCHGSSVAELPGGDLIAVWFQGSGERTADDVAIMGSKYSIKTHSWTEPFVMADTPDFPDINPVVFVDPESTLWLVWYTVIAYQWESSILKYRKSNDYSGPGAPVWKWQDVIHVKADGNPNEGIGINDAYVKLLEKKYDEYFASLTTKTDPGASPVFSPELFETAKKHYLDIARGMNLVSTGSEVTANGEKIRTRLGYPLMRRIGWQTRNKPLFAGKRMLLPLYSDGFDHSLVAMSDDLGKTWQFSEPIVGAGCVQPSFAFGKDSALTAYMRDNGPPPQRLMKSVSKDLGKTWSTVSDSDIPNPGTAADVVVLKSGSWALVHNDVEEGRHRLSVWLSDDEGKTWPHRKVLVNGVPGSATRGHYPAIIQASDGTIHITYTNQVASPEGKEVKNIAHAYMTEEWIRK